MKKSINVSIYPETVPLDKVFDTVKKAGFDAVELNLFDKQYTYPNLYSGVSKDEVKAVGALCEKYSLEIVGIVSASLWQHRLTSNDRSVRDAGAKIIKEMIDIISELGSDSVLVVPGMVDENTSYLQAYDNSLNEMKKLAVYAEQKGVFLGIENVWNKFLLSPLEMRDFIDKIGSSNVGAYFDVGNVLINSYPDYWIEVLGARITRIHVKGFDCAKGKFCFLHEGSVNWERVTKALKAVGYDKYMTSELWAESDVDKAVYDISADITEIFKIGGYLK